MSRSIPCGGCGRAIDGPKRPGDCHWCWLARNHPAYRSWHPDPAVAASAPPAVAGTCAENRDLTLKLLTKMAVAGVLHPIRVQSVHVPPTALPARLRFCAHLGERREVRVGCNSGFRCRHDCNHPEVSKELPQVIPADECQECQFYEVAPSA